MNSQTRAARLALVFTAFLLLVISIVVIMVSPLIGYIIVIDRRSDSYLLVVEAILFSSIILDYPYY